MGEYGDKAYAASQQASSSGLSFMELWNRDGSDVWVDQRGHVYGS